MYISCPALVALSLLLNHQVGQCLANNQNKRIIDILELELDPKSLVEDLFISPESIAKRSLYKRSTLGFKHAGSASFINPKKLFILITQLTKGIENNKIAITYLQNELQKQRKSSKASDKCECVGEKGDKGDRGIPGQNGVPGARGMTVEHYHKSKTKKHELCL